MTTVFITGGTGYIGSRLIRALAASGLYHIKALVRPGSENKLPPGCKLVLGDALNSESYIQNLAKSDVFVHLVGVAHPSPRKKELFKRIDLASVYEAARAAAANHISHFIYVSVAQYPSKIMREYQLARAEGEKLLSSTNLACSFIRPWYVLGPGHWWPLILLPFYWLAKRIPSTRERAIQQGLVSIPQVIDTLLFAIKNPPISGIQIYNVPDIKNIPDTAIDLSPVL